jgi:hypothetical protein
VVTRAEIAHGLDAWSALMAGAAQFSKHLEKRAKERAAAGKAAEKAHR